MMLDRDPQIALDGWIDGLLMLRFDDAVFVPRERVYEGSARVTAVICFTRTGLSILRLHVDSSVTS